MYTKIICQSYMFLLFTSNNESTLRSRMELGKAPMCGPQPNDFKADFIPNPL